MPIPVVLPRFNMEMEEGTVLRWLVSEGEEVAEGDPLCEVETDKVNMEVEAPSAGRLTQVQVAAGVTVPVTSVLAYIATAGEGPASAPAERAPDVAAPASVAPAGAGAASDARPSVESRARPLPVSDGRDRVRASPAARRLAREGGLDLASLADPSGRVTVAVVRRAREEASAPVSAPASARPLEPTRRAIAIRMVRAHEAPHITLDVEVRMRALLELRRGWGVETPSLTAMLAAAACRALGEHPLLNSTFEGGSLATHPEVNLGLAVARPEGLIVPVLAGAGRLRVDELNRRLQEAVRRARDGRLTLEETSGGTFTITSLGEAGVDRFAPLVNPPQVGILAVGRISDRVLPIPGGIGVEPAAWLSLTCDHRVVDGHPGAAFLATLKELIESPAWLRG